MRTVTRKARKKTFIFIIPLFFLFTTVYIPSMVRERLFGSFIIAHYRFFQLKVLTMCLTQGQSRVARHWVVIKGENPIGSKVKIPGVFHRFRAVSHKDKENERE